jgi:hypothetical protein
MKEKVKREKLSASMNKSALEADYKLPIQYQNYLRSLCDYWDLQPRVHNRRCRLTCKSEWRILISPSAPPV